jgi:CubicO group peptidase (beta-lactamase class C family)
MNQTNRPGIIFSVLLLFITITANGQSKPPALDNYFTRLHHYGAFNGNVLIAEKGKIIYEKSFGYADYSTKKLNTPNTSCPVASVTKTIVSTAILQLMEKGKLQLADPYIKYFPAFPYPSVTLKQLLSHTSRIPSSPFYRFLESLQKAKDTFFVNSDVIPALIEMKKPLIGEPKPEGDRSVFAYSNVNYYLLALLIEKLTGMPYQGYVRKYIFFPAGMESSGFSEFYFGTDKNECTEHRYRFLFSEKPERIDTTAENAHIFATYNFKGHGDVVSTLRDLLKYDEALEKNLLLKENTLKLAYAPVVPGNPTTSGYALGWSVLHDSTKGKVVFHHGGGLGIEVMFVRNLAKHQTVIVFDNMKNPAFNAALNALKILNGEEVPIPKRSAAKEYGRMILEGNFDLARKMLDASRKSTLTFYVSEDEINLVGYQFLWNNMDDKALEVLKTNLELFPNGWNAYDSYGEILLKFGRKEEAIKMYQKSIELNPQNEGGKKILEQLLK